MATGKLAGMADERNDHQRELGTTHGLTPDPHMPWSPSPKGWMVDPLEVNPDLRFPESVRAFSAMHRTDSQVSSTLRALLQPIISAQWDLLGDDVDAEVLEFIRSEIGLAEPGDPLHRRRREGIVFRDHLREALKCLPLGFSVFEQVYQYNPADGLLHLRKLAYRPGDTIEKIKVDRDGGLMGIEQTPVQEIDATAQPLRNTWIPVDKLVWYVIEKEGADWTGTPILRAAYKDWFMKERYVRLAGQIVERNGMGVPVAWAKANLPKEARAWLEESMANFRAGATAGAVLPEGTEFDLKGVSGSTVDPLPMINYHDQQISKSMLAMFLDLGHDAGARSLGETFREIYLSACQALAEQVADVFTEHVIRDLVELNFGPEASYPELVPGDLKANAGITVPDLKALADGGLVKPDEKLEEFLRGRYGLPEIDKASRPEPVAIAPQGGAQAPLEGQEEPVAGGATAETDSDQLAEGHVDRVTSLVERVEHLARMRQEGRQ